MSEQGTESTNQVEPHEMPIDEEPPSDDLVANRGPDDAEVEV